MVLFSYSFILSCQNILAFFWKIINSMKREMLSANSLSSSITPFCSSLRFCFLEYRTLAIVFFPGASLIWEEAASWDCLAWRRNSGRSYQCVHDRFVHHAATVFFASGIQGCLWSKSRRLVQLWCFWNSIPSTPSVFWRSVFKTLFHSEEFQEHMSE